MDSHFAALKMLIFLGLPLQMVICEKVVTPSVTSSPSTLTTQAASTTYASVNERSPPSSTMSDMVNALNTVTKNVEQTKYLISTMYNISMASPTYVFWLPQEGVIHMRRNDLMQPIFPNITTSYVRVMQSKRRNKDVESKLQPTDSSWNPGNLEFDEEDNCALLMNLQTERSFIDYVNNLNQHDEGSVPSGGNKEIDEWGLLGLPGWTGRLLQPKQGGQSFQNETVQTVNERPSQSWDLPGRIQQDDLIEHARNLTQTMKNISNFSSVENSSRTNFPTTSMHISHSDADIYISRVNDPFGHSTKWSLKNSSSNGDFDRNKRAVIELYSMIKCSTGCDPIIFKGYGCYCGFLGAGQPVNGIDQCCRIHDKCYDHSNCVAYLEYFVPYIWKCYRGKPLCAIDHGEWGGPSSCAARLCECDLALSRCLRRFVCPQKRAICTSSQSRMLQNLLFNI